MLAHHPELDVVIVFGSMATGRQRPDSDLDLAVMAALPLTVAQRMALVGELALVTARAIDLVDLRTEGEPLLGEILVHGRRVLRGDQAFAELRRKHVLDAADLLPYAQRTIEQRRQAWIAP